VHGAEPDLSPEPSHRRSRIRILALAVLALLLALAAATAWLRADAIRRGLHARLEAELSRVLDGEVRIGTLRLRLHRLTAEVEDLELRLRSEGSPPMVARLERGRLRLAWSGLLSLPAGRVHLAALRLEEPWLDLDAAFPPGRRKPRDRAARPVDLRIDRLEIADGWFRYADRSQPLTVTVENIHVRATWGAYRRALIGELSAEGNLERDPFRGAYPVRIRSGFRLRDRQLDLIGGQASGPGFTAALQLRVAWVEEPTASVDGTVDVDLALLGARLEEGFPEVSGSAHGTLRVDHYGAGRTHVQGDLTARTLRFGPLEAAAVEADLDVRPGRLELRNLEAAAYGGRLEGLVSVELGGTGGLRLDLAGEGLSAEQLIALAALPLPFSGVTATRFSFAGEPQRPGTWDGEGSFEIEPDTPPAGLLPARATGGFTLASGRLRLESAAIETASAAFDLDLDLDLSASPVAGSVGLDGATASAADTVAGTLVLMDRMGVEAPDLLREPLEGRGPVRVEVRLGPHVTIAVELDLAAGSWSGQRFERAQLRLRVDEESLDVERVQLEGRDSGLDASLSLRLDPMAIQRLEGSARAQDLAWVLARLDLDPEGFEGRLSGRVEMRRGEGGLEGEGELRLADTGWMGEHLGTVQGGFRIVGDQLTFDRIEARSDDGIQGEVGLVTDLRNGRTEVRVERAATRLEHLRLLRGEQVDAQGELVAAGSLVVEADAAVSGSLRVEGRDWVLLGTEVGALEGTVEISPERFGLHIEGRPEATWTLQGTLGWSETWPAALQLSLREAPVVLVGRGFPEASVQLSGSIDLEGPLTEPAAFSGTGSLDLVRVRLGMRESASADPVPIRLERQRLHVGPYRLTGGGTELSGVLRYALDDGGIQARSEGRLDLGVITALWSDVRAAGELRMNVSVDGTVERPSFRGRLEVEGGRIRHLGFPQGLEDLRAVVELREGAATLEGARALMGGGEVRASGELVFDGLTPGAYAVEIAANNVRIAYPEGFRGVYEADLLLRGDTTAALLGGRVTLLRGLYNQEFDLGQLLGWGAREYSVTEEFDLPANVLLDVALRADGGLWVRNDIAQVESRFNLRLGGDLGRPEITGRVWLLEDGKIRFRDVNYRIQSGSLDFVELDRINPYLDVRAETRVGDYDVFLRIEGTLDRFNYELTSSPTLSTQDIIALLVTGSTLEALSASPAGGADIFTGDLAVNYFTGAFTDRFGRQMQQLLGLERVQINPMLQGEGDPTARVTLGKEVADNLYIVYSSEIGGPETRLYQIEWQASRKFRLTGGRDTTGGIGGDIQYSTRFRLGGHGRPGAPPPRPAQDRRPEAPPGSVDGIRVEGEMPGEGPQLLRLLPFTPGDRYSRSTLFEGAMAIRRHYVKEGRLEATVEPLAEEVAGHPERVRVLYRVQPGPRVALEIEGIGARQRRRILKLLDEHWIEAIGAEYVYEDAADLIRNDLLSRGYYAADVSWDEEPARDGKAVRFRVDPGHPVRVDSVILEGQEAIPEERIRRQMLTRPASVFSRRLVEPSVLREDLAAIRNLYRDQGFLDVRVDPPRIRLSATGDSAVVTLRITEGPRYLVSRVEVPEGLAIPPERLLEWAAMAEGEVFSPSRRAEAEGALRTRLDGEGFPDARVSSRFTTENSGVTIVFEVEPGVRKRVGEIRLQGNTRTKEKIIRRELLLGPGDWISREKLLRSQHRLYRLGIFQNVRLDYLTLSGEDPETQVLRVQVEEAPPLRATVGLGYDSEGKVRGSFSIAHENLGGYDRSLALQSKASSIERRVQLVGKEPRLFARPLETLITLFWENREEAAFTVDRWSTALRVERKLDAHWTRYLRYNYQKVDLSDVVDSDVVREQKLENLKLGDLGLTYVRDTRDDPFLPRRGGYASAEARLFAPALLSDASFVKLAVGGSTTHTFRAGTQLASSLRYGLALPYGDTATVPLSERYFAGGESTLRGFARDTVGPLNQEGQPEGGEMLLLLNQEFRFPIWGGLKGVLFYDAGNVYLRPSDFTEDKLRHVLGAGIRFETPIGPLRIEYGRKLDRREGESRGQLFFAIGAVY
jgi:outer membrane protein insertion porin family